MCYKCLLAVFVSFSIQHGKQTASLESIGSHGGLNANNLPGGDSEEEERGNRIGETRKVKEPTQTRCANMSARVLPRLCTTKNFLLREKEGIIYLYVSEFCGSKTFSSFVLLKKLGPHSLFVKKVQERRKTCRLRETIVWAKGWWEERQHMGSSRRGSRFHQFIVKTHSLLMKFRDRQFCEVVLCSSSFKSALVATIAT